MKAQLDWSGNRERKGYGRNPVVHIRVDPETDEERAILRMTFSGTRTVVIYRDGTVIIEVVMPRGKN